MKKLFPQNLKITQLTISYCWVLSYIRVNISGRILTKLITYSFCITTVKGYIFFFFNRKGKENNSIFLWNSPKIRTRISFGGVKLYLNFIKELHKKKIWRQDFLLFDLAIKFWLLLKKLLGDLRYTFPWIKLRKLKNCIICSWKNPLKKF